MGEEENCRNCRSWEEEIYWTHFQFIHFSQFLHSGFHQQLAIPENVSKNLRKKLPETVTLRGPSGSTWEVGLTISNDTMLFNHGWGEFVKDHLLQENDLLVFKYNGDSRFDVLMFDGQSLCEKAASYFVRKCGHREHDHGCQTKRKIDESSAEGPSHRVMGGTLPKKSANKVNETSPLGQSIQLKTAEGPPTRTTYSVKKFANKVHETSPLGQPIQLNIAEGPPGYVVRGTLPEKSALNATETSPIGQPITSNTINAETPTDMELSEPIQEEPSPWDEEIEIKPDVVHCVPYLSCRRLITEEEKRNAFQLALAAVTRNGFMQVMKPTHVLRKFYMVIPSGWMVKHLRALQEEDVILRIKENTWRTKFLYQKSRNSGGLSSGWRNFAMDNKLQEFDVCVFEPGNPLDNSVVLDVSIFRVIDVE